MSDLSSLSRYRVENPLASTRNAEVYRAVDTVLKRQVTLKVFKTETFNDRHVRSRLLQALQQAADLVHPHIAWVWDMGEEEKYIYSVDRYIEGKTLDQQLSRSGRLFWEEAFPLFKQSAQALEYAHNRGMFHGNLTVEDMILSPEHGSVLCNFGITISLTPKTHLNLAQEDQKALANLLVRMLTGQVDLSNGEGLPKDWPAGTPRLIAEALERGMGLHPKGFYPSVNDFALAVEELANLPQPPPTPEELAKIEADEKARREAQDAEARAIEEAERQVSLDAARKEIDEQVQRAMLDSNPPTSDEQTPEGDETSSKDESNEVEENPAQQTEAEQTRTFQTGDLKPAVPDKTPTDQDLETKKNPKPSKRRKAARIIFIILLIILIVGLAALGWLLVTGRLQLPFLMLQTIYLNLPV